MQWVESNIKIKTYRAVTLPVVCGYDSWSPSLRKEHGRRVF
jgi:hypothetical protein